MDALQQKTLHALHAFIPKSTLDINLEGTAEIQVASLTEATHGIDVTCLPELPVDNREYIADGRYKVICQVPELTVDSWSGSEIRERLWFDSGSLPKALLERLSRVQLITESHDGGFAGSPDEGNWTWFELGVTVKHGDAKGGDGKGDNERGANSNEKRNDDKSGDKKSHEGGSDSGNNEEKTRWMSHENAFLTKEAQWREGRIFGKDDDLLKALRNENIAEGFIRVCACAYFSAWRITGKKACLILDLMTIRADLPDSISAPRVIVAGIKAPDDELLRNYHGSGGVRYLSWLPETSNDTSYVVVNTPKDEQREGGTKEITGQLHFPVERWPGRLDNPFLVILNTASLSKAETEQLFKHTTPGLEEIGRRLLVVVDADMLDTQTRAESNESCPTTRLSWDQAVEQFWDFGKNLPFHLLIRFGDEGVIYKDPNRPGRQVLVFEPGNIEGHFRKTFFDKPDEATSKGDALRGHLDDAYIAGLAATLVEESTTSLQNWHFCETQIKEAATTALRWSRRYARYKFNKFDQNLATWYNMRLNFDDPVFVPIRLPNNLAAGSSLIFSSLPYSPITHAAWDIVRNGVEDVLAFVPAARFNALVTADRTEIEQFRRIACEIETYLRGPREKPLSIAVFGQPGSGKSFGVEQVIKSIMKETKQEIDFVDLNLSQFQGIKDLEQTFENICSKSTSGKLPVVFFDEFDTTFLGTPRYWLRHFISPLQNGTWTHGNDTKILGAGIYVFIGGTAKTFAEFSHVNAMSRIGSPEVQRSADVTTNPMSQVPEGCGFVKRFLDDELGPSNFKTFHFKFQPGHEYSDLADLFLEIQQSGTKTLPVVFLEDFDAVLGNSGELLGWLKSFLAPMQDGKFAHIGDIKPLGRAIFFFVNKNSDSTQVFLGQQYPEAFALAKGPDFMSRLRGHVLTSSGLPGSRNMMSDLADVIRGYTQGNESRPLSLGIFRDTVIQAVESDTTDPGCEFARLVTGRSVDIQGPNKVDESDEMFVIRRAILLRSLLDRFPHGKLEVDNQVLNAMLGVERFKHGARSLQQILSMSKLPDREVVADDQKPTLKPLTPDHLPADSQLTLHVDPLLFKSWVKKPLIMPAGFNDPFIRLRRTQIEWAKARGGHKFNQNHLAFSHLKEQPTMLRTFINYETFGPKWVSQPVGGYSWPTLFCGIFVGFSGFSLVLMASSTIHQLSTYFPAFLSPLFKINF
ncbi:hypothetical protein QBC40DRAFT_329229 [Triangularia verruculosa]|uniref:ATPase AAA-type core domain-containing protein n=1 Tax=Triangularia verruculosa TaxID=2587418 RepID=A0AAN6XQ60_9PEZI|nr:hypothetical protein QBC40DRAFT_329229 [Triangularia verruculosa]